jgi:ubiquitin-conjugating enzyme (huntingtin interacting protein 2)
MTTKTGSRDEIVMAGLEKAHVDQFESLGFPRTKVVRAPPDTPSADLAKRSLLHFCIPGCLMFNHGSTCLQIEVLKKLNYRGGNVGNVAEDRIVEELLK